MAKPNKKKRETKTARKKKAKAKWMWVEQLYLEVDDIKARLDKTEKWIKEHPEAKKKVVVRVEKLEKAIRLIKEKLNI